MRADIAILHELVHEMLRNAKVSAAILDELLEVCRADQDRYDRCDACEVCDGE